MKTHDLISVLVADDMRADGRPSRGLAVSVASAGFVSLAMFALFVGPRGDIADAMTAPRFLLKPILTLALLAAAYGAVVRLSWPGLSLSRRKGALAVAPLLLALAVVVEMALVPPTLWADRMIGSNALLCLTLLPALSLGPLAIMLCALRDGASTRPAITGAFAGLAAAAIGATFYALNCDDDSPLFVALWYPMATLIVVAAGALSGKRVLRW